MRGAQLFFSEKSWMMLARELLLLVAEAGIDRQPVPTFQVSWTKKST